MVFSTRGFCKIALYKILEKFLRDFLSYKVAGHQSLGYNFAEKEVFEKNI